MAVNLSDDDLALLIALVRSGAGVRDSSGAGNNVANPTWGSEGGRFIRLTEADYADGVSAPRTTTLSPRQISDIISTQDNDASGADENMPNPFGGSSLLAYFGQYFDHGVDFVAKGLSGVSPIGSDSFPITAPRGNQQAGTGVDPDGIPGNGDEIPAEYVNKASPFADLSQVYGSNNAVTDLLRAWTDTPGGPMQSAYLLEGELDASGHFLLPTLNAIRDNYRVMTDGGELTSSDISNYDGTNQALLLDFIPAFASPGVLDLDAIGHNFVAGDGRANENIVLTSIHTVWHRNHNFWVDQLRDLTNGVWTENEYFEAARIMNFSEYQRVVFDEFADALIGGLDEGDDHNFEFYDIGIDPSVAIEFAQAAYRLGHSMINNTVSYVDGAGDLQSASLLQAFMNPANLAAFGVDGLLAGQAAVAHQTIDVNVVDVLRNQLFGSPTDLASLNIFRGRDVGIPAFNEVRAQLFAATDDDSLLPYTGWNDFQTRNSLSDGLMAQLRDAYPDGFETMDLWVGGLAEQPVMGPQQMSQLGSTFTWIVADQLNRLQSGDRFYYLEILDDDIFQAPENQTSFADIIERNTGLTGLPDLVFESGPVPDPNNAPAGRPTISDTTPTQGQLLTAAALGITDADGATGAAFAYQWQVLLNDGWVNIAGANADAFTPGAAQVGRQVRVIATYADDEDHVEYVTSLATSGVGMLFIGDGANNAFNGAAGDDNASGAEGDDILNGAAGDDILDGGSGNDRLYGGLGADQTTGGPGDDWHFVDNAADLVLEAPGEGGMDRVFAGASFVLSAGAEIETMSTTNHAGTGAIDLSGNELANTVFGNEGANVLSGLAGDDRLFGMGGADVLLGGEDADILNGGAGADLLEGGDGDDSLDGAAGADSTVGGLGDDFHFVNAAGDMVLEAAGEGTGDRVFASASYTLTEGAEIERMGTTNNAGVGAINLTGNSLANLIFGNEGANVLHGAGGNDRLFSAGGADTLDWRVGGGRDFLDGGAGADTVRVTGDASAEVYRVYSRAEALAAGITGLVGTTGIVITRNGADTASVVAELDNVEQIVIDGLGGGDSFLPIGDLGGVGLTTSSAAPQILPAAFDKTAVRAPDVLPGLAASKHGDEALVLPGPGHDDFDFQ